MKLHLKDKLKQKSFVIGTFIKTPSMILTEVVSATELDCICLDSEHSPFSRDSLDQCILAARSGQMGCLVRVQKNHPEYILNALDCGATGIVIPHINSPEAAQKAVSSAYYHHGNRGYAGSTRAANYGLNSMEENLQNNAQNTIVIAQIEDKEALYCLDEIIMTKGIDCFFIGIMDLTLSLNAQSPKDSIVINAIEKIIQCATKHDKVLGIFLPNTDSLHFWQAKGVTFFLISSEHNLLRNSINQLIKETKSINKSYLKDYSHA
ncbi:HpcH/HpaI aldolase family protein [Cysteiniphilum halobium]|uniref:HpcH/HpaI aldolase family protein n=1 Tax=Cysteiniphilum halobium TaxID=2219059 RepID=UPI003F8780FF